MPFYHAIVRPEVLAPADRETLSNDVTSVHCDVTGAPRTFVHVLYTVDDAKRLPDNIDVLYRANIRSGRTPEQKAELTTRLQTATAERTKFFARNAGALRKTNSQRASGRSVRVCTSSVDGSAREGV